MRGKLWATVAVMTVAACSNGGGGSLSDAFCNDLRDGIPLMSLWRQSGRDPQDFAGLAYGNMKLSCPNLIPLYADYFAGFGLPGR